MNDNTPTPVEHNPFSSPQVDTTAATATDEKSPPSGMVLAIAIVNLIFGVLGIICTGFSVFGFLMIRYQVSNGGMPAQQSAVFQGSFIWYMIIGTVCVYFLPSVGFLMTALGLIYRKQWGGIMAFIMGALMTLVGLYCIGIGIWVSLGPAALGGGQDTFISVIGVLIMGLAILVYPNLTYGVLLRKKYVAEFVGSPKTLEEDALDA
ncbi:MAG: hypothetical protein ACKVH8_18225 [Pirellulales bacterium]